MSDDITQYPQSFIAEAEGDQIAGVLKPYSKGPSAFGEQTIAVLEDEAGVEHSVWLFGQVLRQKFAELKPEPGELVAVTYLGKRKSTAGFAYKNWSVECPGRPAESFIPDWDALMAQPEEVE